MRTEIEQAFRNTPKEQAMKHTQGEWNCDTNDGCKEIRTRIGSIAQTDGINEEEDLANAKLIAAAPDLLEALRFIRQRMTSDMLGFDKATEAIKKATL